MCGVIPMARQKINLGNRNESKIKTNNAQLKKLHDFLKYNRKQSDETVKNTLIYARAIITRYGHVDYTQETGRQLWNDWEVQGASEQTIRHVLHTLELMALCDGVTLKLERPKLIIKEVDYLSLPEIEAVLSAATNLRDTAILYVLFYCGLRATELIRLNIEDVDLLGRRLYIRGKTKTNRERIVVMTKECARAVSDWIDCRPTICDNVLFPNSYGGRLSRRALHDLVRHAGDRAGLADKKIYPHLLRHSCGTAMARSSVSLAVIQKQLGHSPRSVNVTMRYLGANLADVQEQIDQKFII